MSRRSFSEGGSLGEGGSFSQSGSKLGLTARRPLPYMPRVREMALFGPRDPVAGELRWVEHGDHNPGVGGSRASPATIKTRTFDRPRRSRIFRTTLRTTFESAFVAEPGMRPAKALLFWISADRVYRERRSSRLMPCSHLAQSEAVAGSAR